MQACARSFVCARCAIQVLVCSACDRGQIYCAGECSQLARRSAQREAGRRYQMTRRGRFTHAERSHRYRARQKNVTHQGCRLPTADDVLAAHWALRQSIAHCPPRAAWCCHFCGARRLHATGSTWLPAPWLGWLDTSSIMNTEESRMSIAPELEGSC